MLISSKASKIEVPIKTDVFSSPFLDIHDMMNKEHFETHVEVPEGFENFLTTVYGCFKTPNPTMDTITLDKNKFKSYHPDEKKVLLGFSGGLDSVAQLLLLKKQGYEVVPYSMFNVNFYENGQGNKACERICEKINIPLVVSKFKRCMDKSNPFYKHWQENPIKNQMIMATMADYCLENNIGNISLGDDLDLDISEAKHGTNTTDSRQVTLSFMDGLNHHVPNLKFIPMQKGFDKLERLKLLKENGLENHYYSCLQGRFTAMRHRDNQKKYGVEVFENNCVCSCRKCSHHNLLLHYGNVKKFPEEMIDKCWKTLGAKDSADNVLFDLSIPLEKRIHNLFNY